MPDEGCARRLFASLDERADEPFLLFEDRRLSFKDVDSLSCCYAANLVALGIRRGDSVAVFAETSPEVVAAQLRELTEFVS